MGELDRPLAFSRSLFFCILWSISEMNNVFLQCGLVLLLASTVCCSTSLSVCQCVLVSVCVSM